MYIFILYDIRFFLYYYKVMINVQDIYKKTVLKLPNVRSNTFIRLNQN